MNNQKGKKNKLKVGDKVQIKSESIKWTVSNIVDNFSVSDRSAFFEREIDKTYLPEIGSWIYSHLTQKPLYGKVNKYGANDQDPKTNKEIPGLNNVYVEVRGKFGKFSLYVSERDLKRVK